MKRILQFLFCLLYSQTVWCYQFIHYGIREGLTCSFVVDIAIDRHDRVWIATDNGLSLYDGISFTTFNTYNSPLSDNGLNALLYDETNDQLWIATKAKVSLFSCAEDRFLEIEKTTFKGIQYLARAADGGIWAGGRGTGLCHYHPDGSIAREYMASDLGDIPDSFISIYDAGQQLFIGSVFDGMSRVDLKRGEISRFLHQETDPHSLPGNQVYDFCRDSHGGLWISTDHGLALMDEERGTFTNFKHQATRPHNSPIADHIYSIEEPGDGHLWICTDIGGISILDLEEFYSTEGSHATFRHLTATYDNRGLSSANIRKVVRDRFGNYWIANYGSGISCIRHRGPLFHPIAPAGKAGERSASPKSVRGMFYDTEADELWIGCDNEVWVYSCPDGQPLRWYDLSPYLVRPNGKVYCIQQFQGRIYLGLRDNGLLELSPATGAVRRIDFGEEVDVNVLWDDGQGSLWIGSQVGVFRYQNSIVSRPANTTGQINRFSVFGFLKDQQERIWTGYFGWGICLTERDGRLVSWMNEENGLCGDIVTCLIRDTDGDVWAGTQRGVWRYPKGDYEHPVILSCQEGLQDELIHCLQADANGNIWIGTDRGISCYRKPTGQILNFTYDDGIPYGNIQHGSVTQDAYGNIYMGTYRGTCVFHPQKVLAPDTCSDICIWQQERGNGEHTFRYCVADEAQRDQVEYAYRIRELSNEWNEMGRNTSVTLHGLAPGRYTFEVRANLRHHTDTPPRMIQASLHIATPWWLSGWAYTFYALLLCLAVIAYTHAYRRKVMRRSREEIERQNNLEKIKLNEERLKFFTDITHELRTPLTLIVGPLEDLKTEKDLPASIGKKISLIHANAQQLIDLVNRLLEFRKSENRQLTIQPLYLGELITEVGLRFQELNRNEAVRIAMLVPEPDHQIEADRYVLQVILNNLIGNALKYTPNGIIDVSLQWNERSAIIRVRDTGYGISPNDLPHIFECYYQSENTWQQPGTGIGLALVKELAKLHQADISVESRQGEGTTFTLVLYRDKTYPHAIHKDLATPVSKQEPSTDTDMMPADTQHILLIVEDNRDIRQYIAHSLEGSYRIVEAADGEEGWTAAQEWMPDMVITDIMMPRTDGITLCQRLRNDIRTSHIPIVVLTAKDTIDSQAEGYETGADVYLTKPFSARLLRGCVQRQLEQRQKLAQHLAQRLADSSDPQKTCPVPPDAGLSLLDSRFLQRLNDAILASLSAKELNIGYLCSELGFSHSTLYRKTKALTGLSINEYIRKQRLIRARQMLSQSGYNVSEVAYACGFSDVGYFISCFKKEYQSTPAHYLQSLHE